MKVRNFPNIKAEEEIIFKELSRKGEEFYNKFRKPKDFDSPERREHGCDGCRKSIPTEKFEGYRGHYLWLCFKCFKKLVIFGLENGKRKK